MVCRDALNNPNQPRPSLQPLQLLCQQNIEPKTLHTAALRTLGQSMPQTNFWQHPYSFIPVTASAVWLWVHTPGDISKLASVQYAILLAVGCEAASRLVGYVLLSAQSSSCCIRGLEQQHGGGSNISTCRARSLLPSTSLHVW